MLKKIITFSAVFFIFLFVAGICAYLTISWSIKNEDIIVVPELVGRDVVSVLEQLSDLGLNTRVAGSEYTAMTPKNFVISQDPEPGTIIKEGRDVRIIFSKGPRSIAMPSLVKMTHQNAGAILDEIGLRENQLTYIYSATIEKNRIISHYPGQGIEIVKGTGVDMLISRGRRKAELIMTDLTGFSVDDAILYIEKNGFRIGEITSAVSNRFPLNTVTAHQPTKGKMAHEGSRVNLVINREQKRGSKPYLHDAGPRLFRYRTEHGFLKKHIRVQLSSFGKMDEVLNDFIRPDEDVWVMVPGNTEATVFLYEDNKLVKTEYYQ